MFVAFFTLLAWAILLLELIWRIKKQPWEELNGVGRGLLVLAVCWLLVRYLA